MSVLQTVAFYNFANVPKSDHDSHLLNITTNFVNQNTIQPQVKHMTSEIILPPALMTLKVPKISGEFIFTSN
jgi:hypothetical protein